VRSHGSPADKLEELEELEERRATHPTVTVQRCDGFRIAVACVTDVIYRASRVLRQEGAPLPRLRKLEWEGAARQCRHAVGPHQGPDWACLCTAIVATAR
jgi:hypothetical protein